MREEFQRARRWISRAPECEAGLKREPGDYRAGALAGDRAGERRKDGAKTVAVQAGIGAEVNFVGAAAKLPRLIPPATAVLVGNCRRLKMFVNSARMFRL